MGVGECKVTGGACRLGREMRPQVEPDNLIYKRLCFTFVIWSKGSQPGVRVTSQGVRGRPPFYPIYNMVIYLKIGSKGY